MLHAAQSHTVASMADAALGYAGVKDVSLAFALELPPDQLVSIFTAFTDATEDPLLAGLQLAALSASAHAC